MSAGISRSIPPIRRFSAGTVGGDYSLMQCFVAAVAEGDPTRILSGPDETLESHLMVFAAERARKNGTVEMVLYV